MKQTYLTILLLALLFSCSESDQGNGKVPENTETGLILMPRLNMEVDFRPRSSEIAISDLDGYRLIIDGKEYDIPADGKVKNLFVGECTVILTNNYEDDWDYVPEFSDPRYEAKKTVVIKENEMTTVELELNQANSGIYFVYDEESLSEHGLENITGSIYHGDGIYLEYEDDYRSATGYFAPRRCFIRFTDEEGVILDFMEDEMLFIDPEPGQLWEVSVSVGQIEVGSARIDPTISNITSSN